MSDAPKPKTPVKFAEEVNDSMIANINHALRTPLNGVVGMMELLAKTGLNQGQLRYAHVIRESTESLMLQLDNILQLAKIEDGHFPLHEKACDIQDIVKSSIQRVLATAVKNERPIFVEYETGLPDRISVDKDKLHLALTNLISCSLKFITEGDINLKISSLSDTQDESPKLRFEIQNSEMLHDMLQNALKQHSNTEASDLQEFGEVTVGLITTQKILTTLGGTLHTDSESKTQPLHFDIPYKQTEEAIAPSAFGHLKGKRALILKDKDNPLDMLDQALRLWDIDCQSLDDEDKIIAALERAEREEQPFDILICTKLIEGRMLAALKNKVADLVMITEDDSMNAAWLSEFSAYLVPPIYPEELLDALSSFYMHSDESEKSLSASASQLLDKNDYQTIKAKVMVVEDDFVSRLYAAELLESFGCDVTIVENGQEAVMRLEKGESFDIVFMDCMMPVMDGYNATGAIRQAGHDMPIIALTANTLEQDREKCMNAGMNDYVTKPVRERDLYEVLQKHC